MSTGHQLASPAPVYDIPARSIVSVELPVIVKHFDRGLNALGGEAQLKHVLEHHVGDSKLSDKQNQLPEPVAGISLRPNDPLAKKIPSTGFNTRNVLVRITLPRRTGRKRKRGSDDPFVEPAVPDTETASTTAPDLLNRLRKNEDNYSIEAVGMLSETHTFRTLPDFQLRSADLPIMRELRDHAMVPDYNRLKDFHIDMTARASGGSNFPGPPYFTSIDMPYRYEYQQAATVIFVHDESGKVTTKNAAAPHRRITWSLAPDVGEIPNGPPIDVPKRSPTGELLPKAIKALQDLLNERPLVTKRVALNNLPPMSEDIFKQATQFVGYSFKAGPWRDSLIKYGVDPRKDPKYRFYQTLMFQVDNEAFKGPGGQIRVAHKPASEHTTNWARPLRHTKDDPVTHIFDGKSITANGKTWQVCDLTDPVVHGVFHTDNIRAECDVYQWGWFHNGTIAKGRAIMKDKMKYLFAGETPPEEVYERVARKIEDCLTMENVTSAYLNPTEHGRHASQLSFEVRSIAKSGELQRSTKHLWGGRGSKLVSGGQGEGNGFSEDPRPTVEELKQDGSLMGLNETGVEEDELNEGRGDFDDDDGEVQCNGEGEAQGIADSRIQQ